MPLTKVLITVKTYPTLSSQYEELVCTAGFREDGSWIRIYPVVYRKMASDEQYKKYDWLEIDLVKNTKDFRPESYRPRSTDTEFKCIEHLDTKSNWAARKKICLKNIHYDMANLIDEAKNKKKHTSLAVFKPKEVVNFYAEATESEWDKEKVAKIMASRKIENFFEDFNPDVDFNIVKKLPYKFKFHFIDANGRESKMMIEDWETGQLYWNCLKRHNGDENKAIEDVKKKYFDDFAKTKDLHFYLGTTLEFHGRKANNPFIIIGTFTPKIEPQTALF
jgi:hypothetical protein